MQNVSDLFLRGRAAQHSIAQLTAYNAAFMGNAAIQAMRLGLNAPIVFWSAMGRADVSAEETPPVAPLVAPKAVAPKPAAKPKAQPAPKPKVVASSPAKSVTPASTPAVAPVAKVAPAAAPVVKKAAAKAKAKPAKAEKVESFFLDAPRGGKADPITELKGVGQKLATALNDFGIYHFDQIAALTPKQIDWIEGNQKGFRMVMGRYDLIGQAKARL